MEEYAVRQIALSDKAHELIACALAQRPDQRAALGIHHWLAALSECAPDLLAELMPADGSRNAAEERVYAKLCRGDIGDPLAVEQLTMLAEERAQRRGSIVISEYDQACEILRLAEIPLADCAACETNDSDSDTIYVSFTDPEFADCEASAPHPTEGNTPLLDKLGIDLTRAARAETLTPVIGRAEEIEIVIETLCRLTKRNPALIGPAGVGKTSIVEGLAQRVACGEVPDALRNLRIIMLPVSALVANCKYVGEFEERMLSLLKEASQAGIVLFIDEAHTVLGAGAGGRNGNDLANILKPAMARGEIACIAATTDEEYRLHIESDSALERRFQPVRVQELSPAQTLDVLLQHSSQLARLRGVEVPEAQLAWIVEFAGQYLHNRHFPDKAVDILEQCVAYGLTQHKAVLAQDDIEMVARRMVGMPLDVTHRLTMLHEQLCRRSILPRETVNTLINRLNITLRGFDLRSSRPNAVVLLIGEAETQSGLLAELIAEHLFSSAERVVDMDFSRFFTQADTTMLIGSPPGYVGYEGRVTLHQVMQMPWCVLRCENVQAGHPSARDILTHGLCEGIITLADGKRVYLSDAVIVLTADISNHNPIGFSREAVVDTADLRERAAQLLGISFVDQVDIICADLCVDGAARRQWLQESLLADLCRRFHAKGVQLSFDQSLFPWLLSRSSTHFTETDWERLIEEHLCPVIIPHLPCNQAQPEVQLRVLADGDCCRVEPCVMN